jgi:hypothetical protein
MLLVPKGIDKSALLGLTGFYLSNGSYSTKRILFTITSFFYTNVECTASEGRYDLTHCSNAVENAGYSHALYTGSDHSGLKRFLDGKVEVLIASRPVSVGVDGLQHISNRLIINTLPWTNAQYQQLLGRLVRKGQINCL